MEKRIYQYVLQIPESRIRLINSAAIIFLVFFYSANTRFQFSTEAWFLVITPLLWLGAGLLIIWCLVQYLASKNRPTWKQNLMICLAVAMITMLLVAPPFCYYLIKYYGESIQGYELSIR